MDDQTDQPDQAGLDRAQSSAQEEFRRQRLLRDMDRMDRMILDRTSGTEVTDAQVESQDEPLNDDSEQRSRLQRVLARLNTHHNSATSSYGDRIPPPAQQSLYDWAPRQESSQDDDDDQGLDEILGDLRRQHPGTQSDVLEFLGRRQLYRQRESEEDARTRWRGQHLRNDTSAMERRSESLRSAAIMQNARTSVRSPSGTERMLRYLRNRERNGERSEANREDAEDSSSVPSRASALTGSNLGLGSRYESNRLAWQSQQPSFQSSRSLESSTERDTRRENDVRARIDAYRRGYLADNPMSDRPLPSSHLSPSLENAVKYLDHLRGCYSYEDSLSAAIDHGLALRDFFAENHEDFVTSMQHCRPPAQSSLLQPGAVFEGTQNTASHRDGDNSSLSPSGLGNSIYSHDPSRTFDATRPWLSHTPIPPTTYPGTRSDSYSNVYKPFQDRWPVKVIIQAVDYEKMTVAGIMEAYDVPTTPGAMTSILSTSSISRGIPPLFVSNAEPSHQYPSATKKTVPVTTYLEGQIIDFSTYSFLTPTTTQSPSLEPQPRDSQAPSPPRPQGHVINFPPTSAISDAANWRNLPPFNAMKSDDEVARTLLSRSSMDEIMSEWVFMRWKERCFIPSESDPCRRHDYSSGGMMPLSEGDDTHTGHGLTISGFYYVSLRRSDGKIDGLYFDTKTSPYQHLRLDSRRSGLQGVWHFK